jgi:hypothetical protein
MPKALLGRANGEVLAIRAAWGASFISCSIFLHTRQSMRRTWATMPHIFNQGNWYVVDPYNVTFL